MNKCDLTYSQNYFNKVTKKGLGDLAYIGLIQNHTQFGQIGQAT